MPLDPTNANGVVADPAQVIGRIPVVSILQGQLITTNMLASSAEGGQFSILGPDESITPGLASTGGRSRSRSPTTRRSAACSSPVSRSMSS